MRNCYLTEQFGTGLKRATKSWEVHLQQCLPRIKLFPIVEDIFFVLNSMHVTKKSNQTFGRKRNCKCKNKLCTINIL